MAVLLNSPEQQFCDANGKPYAAGTLATYITGTSTPKSTWSDPGGTSLNANPVVLDSAGRCLLYGDGGYRLVLHDAAGNLIWDQPASTLVSAAMAPVVLAATLSDARDAMGITALLNAESAARAAADSAEATARAAGDATNAAAISAETTRAEAAEANLQSQITAEVARAEAAEAALSGSITALGGPMYVRTGSGTTNGSGVFSVTFSPAFAHDVLFFHVWKLPHSSGVSSILQSLVVDGSVGNLWGPMSQTMMGFSGPVYSVNWANGGTGLIQPASASGITSCTIQDYTSANYVGNFGWLAIGW